MTFTAFSNPAPLGDPNFPLLPRLARMEHAGNMKVLRLDPEQAALLAGWLRMAAVQLDRQAAHLRSCGHSFAEPARVAAADAERARRLAGRLG